eukprot:gene16210-11596_t
MRPLESLPLSQRDGVIRAPRCFALELAGDAVDAAAEAKGRPRRWAVAFESDRLSKRDEPPSLRPEGAAKPRLGATAKEAG